MIKPINEDHLFSWWPSEEREKSLLLQRSEAWESGLLPQQLGGKFMPIEKFEEDWGLLKLEEDRGLLKADENDGF